MTVNLSLLAGAGWQFFDSNGDPLTGGKLYTYAAGTTTPLATYTSASGLTPNTNPIILNAAGRLNGSGEIWLTQGSLYKFILTDSNDVLIGTYDDVSGATDGSVLIANLANTSDPAKGDALVGFRQSDVSGLLPGAVGRTVHQKLQETVSVKDFGAVGNGVADDTAALQSAFASGKPLYFPAGVYVCSTRLSRTSGDLVLVGDGANVSELQFTGSTNSTAGIYFTPQTSENYTRVESLTLSTTTGYVLNKNALHIDGSAQVVPGPTPITQNRSTRRIYVNDLIVSGINNSASTGWSAGIKITSLGLFSITNYTFMGDFSQGAGTGNWKGQAIWIQGYGLPTEAHITDFYIYSSEFGVLMPDYFEGLYLNTFDMVNVQYGFYAQYDPLWSTVQANETTMLQPTISQGHINCRRYALICNNVNQAYVAGLNIYLNPETGDSNYGGILLNNGSANTVSFNHISKVNAAVTTLSWGVTLLNSARNNVTANQIYNFNSSGVFLSGANSDSNYVAHNLFFNTSEGVTSSTNATGNTLILNEGLLLSGALYSVDSRNYIEKRKFAASFVVTLTGGSPSETVVFSVPSDIFTAKPQAGFLMQADTVGSPNQCIGYYEYTASTSTSAVFRVASSSGANITAGLTRFVVSLFE